jgi:hypothetical protein
LIVLPNQAGMPIRHPLLGLVKHSRATDSWLWLLVILDQDVKLKRNMNVPNWIFGLAEYSGISMEGVNLFC